MVGGRLNTSTIGTRCVARWLKRFAVSASSRAPPNLFFPEVHGVGAFSREELVGSGGQLESDLAGSEVNAMMQRPDRVRRPVSATVVVLLTCIQATALILQFPVISRIGYSAVVVAVEFVYLLFVPGALMLLLLEMEDTNKWKRLVFTAGASLGFEMLTGAALSVTLPLLGVPRPLQPSIVGIAFIGSTLCMTAGVVLGRGMDKRVPGGPLPKLDAYSRLSIMLPVLATLGAALENSGGGNAVLLTLI